MMNAVLKIKPQLDQGEAKKMERSLFDRFKNIGKSVKKTLKDVVSGGLLGFAIGLAQNMLSPIEEVENRIKGILDKAGDFREMADDFGTSAGKLRQLETLGLISGLKPENLKAMMVSFRNAVDEAQSKIAKGEALDDKSSLVKNFAGSEDMAEAFFQFVQSLRTLQSQQRQDVERSLFGSVQRGASQRFIDNAGTMRGPQGYVNPRIAQFDKAIDKLSDLDNKYLVGKFSQENRELLNNGSTLNGDIINKMLAYENRQKAKELDQLKAYDDLNKARQTVEELTKVMDALTKGLTSLVGYLGDFISWVKASPWAKGFVKTLGRGN